MGLDTLVARTSGARPPGELCEVAHMITGFVEEQLAAAAGSTFVNRWTPGNPWLYLAMTSRCLSSRTCLPGRFLGEHLEESRRIASFQTCLGYRRTRFAIDPHP